MDGYTTYSADFNPRLREGGDIICIVGNSCIVNFNPRLREGGDKIDILFPPNKRYFNPRLREGGDKEYLRNNGGKKNFNPRLREGGDGIQRHNRLEESKISIHASAKEATTARNFTGRQHRFQSTPPRRRRQGVANSWAGAKKFQSTPPRRRRRSCVCVVIHAP